MANILANIEKTLPKVVDKVFAVDSLTERLIGNNEVKVDFVGARTVKVFKLNLSGLTPYVRGGHAGANVRGAVRSELETFTLSQERYIEIPLHKFVVVTGVSGSGTSSLVNEILYNFLAKKLYRSSNPVGECDGIDGTDQIDRVIQIDQTPIGRTPRSNPATYTGVFDAIRDLFATTLEAKKRGYTKSRFSFNVKGGRCETCQGDGVIRIAMHFLPDVYVECEACHGKRYNQETLEVKYKGKSISDVLDMTVEDACEFFENIPQIYNKMKTLNDVGLGYIKLGQSATTLSGGEAQRVKLASELYKKLTDKTLFIFDEPTTGLHTYDVDKLMTMVQNIVKMNASVVIIEHNLDVIKLADYIIDLGPTGGNKGGYIIAKGTPEEVIQNPQSATGVYLKKVLAKKEE